MSVMLTLISCKPILFEFRFERVLDVFEELIAIAVDLFDSHRGDHLPQLAEDHFLGLLADFPRRQAEQTDGRVLHHIGSGIDRDGEHAGHVHADVFGRQRAAQRHFDLDRFQAQVGVVLHERPDERRRRGSFWLALATAFAGAAIDHQHAVAGAAFER